MPQEIPTLESILPFVFDGSYKDEQGRINPYHFDFYLMGMTFSRNIEIMMENHTTEKASFMILVNRTTGQRVKINFPESWQ